MASSEAWSAGWNLGSQLAQEQRAHKQALSDEEFQTRFGEIQQSIGNLQNQLADTAPGSVENLKIRDALTQAVQSRNDLFHPAKNPGALQKFGHLLRLTHPAQRQAVAPPVYGQPTIQQPGYTTEPVQLAAQPGYRERQISRTDRGFTTTAQPGTPAATLPGMEVSAGPPITAGPAYEVRGPQTPRQLRAQAQARIIAAGAPPSPEQQAARQAQAGIMGKEAQANWALDWAQRHGVTGQALDELTQHLAGLPVSAESWTPITGKFANGQQVTLLRSKDGRTTYMDGRPVEPALLGGFVAMSAAKPPTSKFGLNVESYKELHKIPAEQSLTPEQLNFVEQQIALSSAAPSTNITNTLKQDYRGFWVPIQESNRRIPGFGVILKDPLGPVPETPGAETSPAAGAAAGPGGDQVLPTAVPKTPAEAKKQAQARRGGATTPRAGGAGAVRVGRELFAAPSKQYNDAKAAYDGALVRMETMDKNLRHALVGDQQAMLSLVANHIGMTLGAQKGARINQAVWNEAVASAPWLSTYYAKVFHNDPQTGEMVFDGWKSGVTLTDDQMRSMVSLAHEQVDTLKDALDRITKELTTPQGGAPQPAGGYDWSKAPERTQ
jgi:hypothetical protein